MWVMCLLYVICTKKHSKMYKFTTIFYENPTAKAKIWHKFSLAEQTNKFVTFIDFLTFLRSKFYPNFSELWISVCWVKFETKHKKMNLSSNHSRLRQILDKFQILDELHYLQSFKLSSRQILTAYLTSYLSKTIVELANKVE